jgi:hypothetical protein
MLRRIIFSQETRMSFVPEHETLADPKALLNVPVGLSSPLWPLFAGAAMSGAAWWWMTRWTQPANLEAMFGAAVKAEVEVPTTIVAEAVALAEPVIEASETAPEPVIEAAPESVLEALIEAPAALEPVGGEAAPVSPVLAAIAPETAEADAAPKPKKKPAVAPTPEAD